MTLNPDPVEFSRSLEHVTAVIEAIHGEQADLVVMTEVATFISTHPELQNGRQILIAYDTIMFHVCSWQRVSNYIKRSCS
jgi:hypothetical protein